MCRFNVYVWEITTMFWLITVSVYSWNVLFIKKIVCFLRKMLIPDAQVSSCNTISSIISFGASANWNKKILYEFRKILTKSSKK